LFELTLVVKHISLVFFKVSIHFLLELDVVLLNDGVGFGQAFLEFVPFIRQAVKLKFVFFAKLGDGAVVVAVILDEGKLLLDGNNSGFQLALFRAHFIVALFVAFQGHLCIAGRFEFLDGVAHFINQ
jgi:hypothetical protein